MKVETMPNSCLAKLKLSDEYILHSSINELLEPSVAVSLSTNEILQYDVEKQVKVSTLKSHHNTVTCIKFSKENPSHIFTSSLDGSILIWDLRDKAQIVSTFADTFDSNPKPITCFDYNVNEQYICGGTEIINDDSFLIFWDKRSKTPLGGYWNSHHDDITQVQFHTEVESHLATSSADGTINFFDLNESCEDDALQDTLNIDSAVNCFTWGVSNTVACITSIDQFQFWCTSKGKPNVCMSKKQISEDLVVDVDYLISTFSVRDESYLVAGANDGSLQLYSCKLDRLRVIKDFNCGHTDVIRTACHSTNKSYLVTGGEDGILCIWKSPL